MLQILSIYMNIELKNCRNPNCTKKNKSEYCNLICYNSHQKMLKNDKIKNTLETLRPKCAVDECDNLVMLNKKKHCWSECCSKKCQAKLNSIKTIEKRKTIFQERYGVDSPLALKEIRNKAKETYIKNYGVENPFQNEEIKKKIKKTCLTKYGVENPSQSSEVMDKIRKTFVDRYGCHPSQTDYIKRKIEKSNLEKYGVPHWIMNGDLRQIKRDEYKSKHGVSSPNTLHFSPDLLELLNDKEKLSSLNQVMTITEMSEKYNCSQSTFHRAFSKHNIKPKIHFCSQPERDLQRMIADICSTEIISRYKLEGDELDLFIPEFNLAIEHNGLFYHSELAGKGKKYHLNKSKLCEKHGIKLLHIFADDLILKKDIIKSIITNHLKKSKRIGARLCNIRRLDSDIEKEFLDKNHIQGYVRSRKAYGLFLKDTLVSVMSFGMSRYSKDHEWELLRYANLLGHTINGGASRLFNFFINDTDADSIISYAHRHLFSGNLYKTLNFKFLRESSPSYYYTKDYDIRESRIKYQKHKLSKLLEIFDPDLSEWENMKLNNFDRIWDCGTLVWEFRRFTQ